MNALEETFINVYVRVLGTRLATAVLACRYWRTFFWQLGPTWIFNTRSLSAFKEGVETVKSFFYSFSHLRYKNYNTFFLFQWSNFFSWQYIFKGEEYISSSIIVTLGVSYRSSLICQHLNQLQIFLFHKVAARRGANYIDGGGSH